MKKEKIVILVFTIIISLFITFVSGFLVHAQEEMSTGVTVSPVHFEFSANPGDKLENKLQVLNPTENTISVKMEVEDFVTYGEEGEVRIQETEDETYSLKKWVKTTPNEFTLKPKESKLVTFTVNIPKNAEPGGKYGSILATMSGLAGEEGAGLGIAQKVGALLLLSVSGRIEEKIEVKEFSTPNFREYGPINFTIRFENTGTVHVRPRGSVTINNIFGHKVADVEFPQQNVIPGAIRKNETTWNQNWLWGVRYTATLVGSYGSQNSTISSVISFWVFPWKIWLVILLVLVIVIYFIVRTRRKIKRAEEILKKQQEEELQGKQEKKPEEKKPGT